MNAVSFFLRAVSGQRLGSLSTLQAAALPTPASVVDVVVGESFFANGLLKANVSWQLPPGQSPLLSCFKIN
jgi:hypothetical protein